MNRGLIVVERTDRIVEMGELIKSGIIRTTTKREAVTYSVLSIRDPTSAEKMSVAEALRRGVINQVLRNNHTCNKAYGKLKKT